MSLFTLLPAIKVESASMILFGGLLMLVLGVLYIALEKSLLISTAPRKQGLSAPKADGTSRAILGAQVALWYMRRDGDLLTGVRQVGLIALAMLVTRSSVASLQAKQGLPLGTQMAGWCTLGESPVLLFFASLYCFPNRWSPAYRPAVIRRDLPDIPHYSTTPFIRSPAETTRSRSVFKRLSANDLDLFCATPKELLPFPNGHDDAVYNNHAASKCRAIVNNAGCAHRFQSISANKLAIYHVTASPSQSSGERDISAW